MPVSTAPISDWGTAVMTSLTAALALFLTAIPKVIGFLAILIVGWFVAGALARVFANVLRTLRFNELASRSGFAGRQCVHEGARRRLLQPPQRER